MTEQFVMVCVRLCMECCECAICGSDSGRGDRTQWIHEVYTQLNTWIKNVSKLVQFPSV